jgi:MoaA/NifB/PqqE/SkfB family radical SAM enzyme
MDYTIPKYSEDRSVDIGKSNLEKLKKGRGKLEFSGVYIHLAPVCNFDCAGCFASPEKKESRRLSYETVCRIVDFAGDRGAESVVFAGAGEPMLDPDFYRICQYANKKGLQTILFTNCSMIKDIEKAKEVLLNGPVIGKLYSMNEKKYDEIVNKKGAFEETMKGLKLLIEAKEELEKSGKKVVLGVDCYATRRNRKDVQDVLRFCRKNKIVPYIEAFIEIGQTKQAVEEMRLTERELTLLFGELKRIDREEFGIETPLKAGSRNYGQDACFKATHMFSVRNNGDVHACVCSLGKIGNVYKNKDAYKSLEEAFDTKHALLESLKCENCSVKVNPKFLKC